MEYPLEYQTDLSILSLNDIQRTHQAQSTRRNLQAAARNRANSSLSDGFIIDNSVVNKMSKDLVGSTLILLLVGAIIILVCLLGIVAYVVVLESRNRNKNEGKEKMDEVRKQRLKDLEEQKKKLHDIVQQKKEIKQ